MRKKNTDISKSNNDLNDVEYLKTRITLLDNVVQKITKEKNTLNQELERTKYELLKKNQELETKLASKETELRRVMNKLKPLELEYKNLNSALIDEKKRLKECQKNLEMVSTYMYQSYAYLKKNMQGLFNTFKQSLFTVGYAKKKTTRVSFRAEFPYGIEG